MFVACGALRLARFNVQKDVVDSSFFRGLPIPAAACFVASLVLFEQSVPAIAAIKDALLLGIMYVLSFVMVSTLDYFSFKKLQLGYKKPFSVLVSIILASMVVAYKPSVMLFLLLLVYVASGPIITALRIYRKRRYGEPSKEQAPIQESFGGKG
jgi:CDP-diacylglycerol--serine O-phosphatidyltransferase